MVLQKKLNEIITISKKYIESNSIDYSDYFKIVRLNSKALGVLKNINNESEKVITKIYNDLVYYNNLIDKNLVDVPFTKRRGASTRVMTSNHWYLQNIKYLRGEFEKALQPKYGSYEVGDMTPIGIIKDKTNTQYLINGQWYAKSILANMKN